MKQNIGTKLSVGLLVALVTWTAAKAAIQSKAADAERQKAQAAEARARQAEVERR